MTKRTFRSKPASLAGKRLRWPMVLTAICFAVLGSLFLLRSFAANPNLPGDLDNNNQVNLTDLSILLTNWGQPSTTHDLNGDGTVNLSDLSILLSHWNQVYTPPNPTPNPPSPTPTPPNPTPTPNPGPTPVPSRQIKIMPFGSSTIVGTGSSNGAGFRPELYTKLIQEDKLNVDFVGSQTNGPTSNFDRNHEGHSGWTIGNNSSLSASVQGWLNTYKPDVMLFYAGMNDLRGGASGAETASRFDAIAAKIFATSPNIKLIAATTMKKTDEPSLNVRVADYNSRMYPIAEKYRSQGKYIQIVDIDAVITPADHYDSLHVNDAGYRKMVPVWLAGIRATYPTL